MKTALNRPALPEGWFYPEDAATAAHLHAELLLELTAGHLLFGCVVKPFAYRHGSDDVLFQHQSSPRFTVVHLTWIGKPEIDAKHPTVEYDGTFEGFVAEEERRYGLKPPAA
ncbi:MAG: hypothetical protein FWC42_07825 [Proteobacteria bacterium]|nr:hypothetical protein [Pseudomonadota bacterium]